MIFPLAALGTSMSAEWREEASVETVKNSEYVGEISCMFI